MKETAHHTPADAAWIPSLAIALLAAGLAAPSLIEAWLHDGYSRGGPAAFTVWVLVLAAASILHHGGGRRSSAGWTLFAALCCAAGSMADLRVLHHLGLGGALTGLAGLGRAGIMPVLASMAWMPAAGWFLSRISAGGLAGWERPGGIVAGALVILYAARGAHPRV